MNEHGRLEANRRSPLPDTPATCLARIALCGLAREEGRLHLVFPERDAANHLAAHLGAAPIPSATDSLQRFWQSGALLLHEGDLDEPEANASHALAGRDHVVDLIETCRTLGLGGAIDLPGPFRPHQEISEAEEPRPDDGGSQASIWIPHRPRFWRGEGRIELTGDRQDPIIEQITIIDGHRVAETHWPSGSTKIYSRARVDGLSSDGAERLQRLGFRRDLRVTCSTEELRALLAHHRLPCFDAVLRFESLLGGLMWSYSGHHLWAAFGAFATLTRNEELGGTFGDGDDNALQGMDDWPRVRREGRPLVPVGFENRWTVYVDEAGRIYEHDENTEDLAVFHDDPLAYLEAFLRRLNGRRR